MGTLFLDSKAAQTCRLSGVCVPSDETQELAETSSARRGELQAPFRDPKSLHRHPSSASQAPPTCLAVSKFALLLPITSWVAHREREGFEVVIDFYLTSLLTVRKVCC